MKRFRDYVPYQQFLMPPSLQDWLPEGHLAYFICDVVDEMNTKITRQIVEVSRRIIHQ